MKVNTPLRMFTLVLRSPDTPFNFTLTRIIILKVRHVVNLLAAVEILERDVNKVFTRVGQFNRLEQILCECPTNSEYRVVFGDRTP